MPHNEKSPRRFWRRLRLIGVGAQSTLKIASRGGGARDAACVGKKKTADV